MPKKETNNEGVHQISLLVEAYKAFQHGGESRAQADLLKKSGNLLLIHAEGWHYVIGPSDLARMLHLHVQEVKMQLLTYGAATTERNTILLSPEMKPTGIKAIRSK